jgi:hypothetical protein
MNWNLIIESDKDTPLARIFHEWSPATADVGILPDVPEFRTLRRTVQVRLGYKTPRVPGGKSIFTVS